MQSSSLTVPPCPPNNQLLSPTRGPPLTSEHLPLVVLARSLSLDLARATDLDSVLSAETPFTGQGTELHLEPVVFIFAGRPTAVIHADSLCVCVCVCVCVCERENVSSKYLL